MLKSLTIWTNLRDINSLRHLSLLTASTSIWHCFQMELLRRLSITKVFITTRASTSQDTQTTLT